MAFARARPCTRTHTNAHQWENVTVFERVLLLDPPGTGYGDGANRLCSRPAARDDVCDVPASCGMTSGSSVPFPPAAAA